MDAVRKIVDEIQPHSHYVQFYKADEPMLNRNVGYFLWEGLLRGDGLIVIATEQRRRSLSDHLRRLGADTAEASMRNQLLLRDADEMLDRFMVAGRPDRGRFNRVMRAELSAVSPSGSDSIRAYGEMVGILWERGLFEAAIQVEEYWNELLHVTGIALFCGYPIDVFAEDLQSARMKAVLSQHTQLMPTGPAGTIESAVKRAIHEVLGSQTDAAPLSLITTADRQIGASLSSGEAIVAAVLTHFPDSAEEILRKARKYYRDESRDRAA